MTRMVLFAGGPLHGQVLPVESAPVLAMEPVIPHDYTMPHDTRFGPTDYRHCPPGCPAIAPPAMPGAPLAAANVVSYTLRRAQMFGHILWLGTLGDPETDPAIAMQVLGAVLTDGARQALAEPLSYEATLAALRRAGHLDPEITVDESPANITDPDSRRACCGSKWGYPHARQCQVPTEGTTHDDQDAGQAAAGRRQRPDRD